MTSTPDQKTSLQPAYVVGGDIGGSHIAAALVDSTRQLVARRSVQFSPAPDSNLNLMRLFDLLDDLVAQTTNGDAVLALGVPATIDYHTNTVVWAPALGWTDLALGSILADRYQLPVQLENDVNLAALAEHRYGAGQGVQNLVCILVGTNIGGGIILDGNLYHGSHGMAGEIGMMIPNPMLFTEDWGDSGCLESFAGGRGIAQRARFLAAEDSPMVVAAGDIQSITAKHVFAAARQSDGLAQRLVQNAIDHLSLAIANTVCILDPELIILGGGVFGSADLLLESLKANVKRVAPHMPRFVLAELDEDSVLVGALTLAAEGAGWPRRGLEGMLNKKEAK